MKLRLSKLDIALITFIAVRLLNILFVSGTNFATLDNFIFIGFVIFYMLMRMLTLKQLFFFVGVIIFSGMIQAMYGNLQLFGVYSSHHSRFNITGSFYNPGPYAGYLSLLLPVSLYIYLSETKLLFIQSVSFQKVSIGKDTIPNNDKTMKSAMRVRNLYILVISRIINLRESLARDGFILLKHKIFRILSLMAFLTMLVVLPATTSRAAWIAAIVSSLIVIEHFYPIGRFLKKYLNTLFKRLAGGFILLCVTVAIVAGIYFLKKDSADGRVLIWKVSMEMVKDRPLLGFGVSKFPAYYMEYQAKYFSENENSPEAYVADDISYPFNEYLKILTELGLAGLFPILYILFMIGRWLIRRNKDILLPVCGIVSLAVFSFFSYPSEILPIKMAAVCLLAYTARSTEEFYLPVCSSKWFYNSKYLFPKFSLAMILISISVLSIRPVKKLYHAYSLWYEAYTLYNMDGYSLSIDSYSEAGMTLNTNGDFLIMYGKALAMYHNYSEAIQLLDRAKQYKTNTILYNALGDSYKGIGVYNLAEEAYSKARQMIPSRMYPGYLLVKLYVESGKDEKARSLAKELIDMNIKIPSNAIDEMKAELYTILLNETESY